MNPPNETGSAPTPIVSFLGPVASYTHQTALQCFEKRPYEYAPAITIQDVFEAVQSGKAARGVVPFENSTNGAVIFTLELLADREGVYPDLVVSAEAYLDVSHCLLGRKAPDGSTESPGMSGSCTPTSSSPSPQQPRTKPLTRIRHVKRVITHPQAYGQCENFLGTYLKGVERRDESSTSKSAGIVAEDESGTSAAIASSLAAKIYGLDILAEGIEDRDDNTTRFLILQKGADQSTVHTGSTKSLVSFTVDHNLPGALANVLDCFRTYKLNLTSINSRPTKRTRFEYIFFVEFEGSRFQDPEGRVARALESLSRQGANNIRCHGSWEAQSLPARTGRKNDESDRGAGHESWGRGGRARGWLENWRGG